jgi:pyruvate/2-oxoglutarate dehydrogenase complex dihydrolipoamide acyltransferase (E2) component
MMPSMSPFMTEGTITRWAKKEGDAFQAGDVLFQIESEVTYAMPVDVKAETAGILGKILLPEGSTNVPVEQVIALVSQSQPELAGLKLKEVKVELGPDVPEVPSPPPFNPLPSPPSQTISSPTHKQTFSQPFMSPTLRSPHLYEATTSHAHHRGMATRHAAGGRTSDLTIIPPSPSVSAPSPLRTVYPASARTATTQASYYAESPMTPTSAAVEKDMMDGAALRRMIVSNLTKTSSGASIESQNQKRCDTKAYFDGIL